MDKESPYRRQIDDWNRAARHSRRIAGFVREIGAWICGDELPPYGLTRTDVFVRGLSWSGWEWVKRGYHVSYADFEERRAESNVAFRKTIMDIMSLSEKGRTARFSSDANDGTTPANPFRGMIDGMTRVLESISEYQNVLVEESNAWRHLDKVLEDAQDTISNDEIEAAHARLADEQRPTQEAARVSAALSKLDDTTQAIRADTQVTRAIVTRKANEATERGRKNGKKGAKAREPNKDVENALRKVHDLVKNGLKIIDACRKVVGWKHDGTMSSPVYTLSGKEMKPVNLARRYRMKNPGKNPIP